MDRGFWKNLKRPIIGLAPMDGVTDASFRNMVCRHSDPDVLITEFTNVEGLARGAVDMLRAFVYSEIERPVVAQIYGVEVDSYYKCSVMLSSMGFDGIDINMGCPANKVAKKGSGAGLIRTPQLAKEIISSCKKGVKDWAEGISLEEAGVHPNIIAVLKVVGERKLIPVSVKTRVGYDEDVATEWVKHLMEENPANITMHGRTLKQMYTGESNWESIAKAALLVKGSGICFLGNGDVISMEDARSKIDQYGIDGVLVGRATFGNPWFFSEHVASQSERLDAVIEHCHLFEELTPNCAFHNIKKHLAWYCKGFEGARELRMKLMRSGGASEVEEIIQDIKKDPCM